LRAEGTIHSVRGAGTFISSPVLAEAPNNLLSFSRLSQARGLVPSSQVISVDEHPASIEEGEQCGVAPGMPVIVIERVRLLDGLPVAIGRSTVPAACAPRALEADWTTASLYDELSAAGNPPVRADYAIEARAADHSVAEQLKMTFGHPVLLTSSTSYAATGRIVEVALMTYRGDRYRFRGTLHA
jgi:GntR family transcriptional regulator